MINIFILTIGVALIGFGYGCMQPIIYDKTSKDLAIELNYSKEQIDNKYKSSLESLYNKSSYLKLKYKEYTRIKEFKSTHFDSLVEKSAFKHITWRG